MQIWLLENEAPEIAAVLPPYFPTQDATILTNCINRHKSAGIGGKSPILPRDGFERLRNACLSGGLIKSGTTYEDCIEDELALAAVQEVDRNEGVASSNAYFLTAAGMAGTGQEATTSAVNFKIRSYSEADGKEAEVACRSVWMIGAFRIVCDYWPVSGSTQRCTTSPSGRKS